MQILRRLVLIPFAAATIVLGFTIPAQASIRPTAYYELFNSDSWFGVTVNTNPENYGVQAELKCVSGGGQLSYYYGDWVYSPGAVSTAISNCTGGGGYPAAGYLRWRKSDPMRVTCWIPGDS